MHKVHMPGVTLTVKPDRVSQRYWVGYPVWPHTFVSPSANSREAVVSYWRKYVHEALVNRLGGLRLPRKSVVRLTDHPHMTLDVYRGHKTTTQHNHDLQASCCDDDHLCQITLQFLHTRKSYGPDIRFWYHTNKHIPYAFLPFHGRGIITGTPNYRKCFKNGPFFYYTMQ